MYAACRFPDSLRFVTRIAPARGAVLPLTRAGVWLLFGLATVAVFETYWRLPPAELWKVTNSGFVGGAGRAFVFVSFSAATIFTGA